MLLPDNESDCEKTSRHQVFTGTLKMAEGEYLMGLNRECKQMVLYKIVQGTNYNMSEEQHQFVQERLEALHEIDTVGAIDLFTFLFKC